MTNHSRVQKFSSVISLIIILSLMIGNTVYATTEASKRSEAKQAGQKATELYKKVGEAESKIREIQTDINNKQAEINQTKTDIEKAKEDIEKQNNILNDRLSVMYKTGSIGIIEVILSSSNVNELLTNIGMVQKILSNDRKILKGLKKKRKELENLQKDLSKQEEDLKKSQDEVQAIRDKYKSEAEEYKKQEQQLLDEANQMAIETARAQAEAEKKLAEQNTSEQSTAGSSSGGGYLWPLSVNGVITSGYGWRSDPLNGGASYHNGLDIAVPLGTPVRAIADGYVTLSSYDGPYGYGNYIIISIGGGKQTLYGHLNSRIVSTGQYVSRGQVVGYVGTTGRSTGPHLHFTLFLNGADANPYSLY